MQTIINNNERVFLIHREGFFVRDYFCNLAYIPNILSNELEKHDNYTVSEYWNKKFKRCSKKHLNEMFAANKIEFKIN
jgi:hypothetical protein